MLSQNLKYISNLTQLNISGIIILLYMYKTW